MTRNKPKKSGGNPVDKSVQQFLADTSSVIHVKTVVGVLSSSKDEDEIIAAIVGVNKVSSIR